MCARAEQSRRRERETRDRGEREREKRCARALNRADAERERQRERDREREREREREERGVCARWESKTSRWRGSTRESQKLGLGAFLKGKRSLKGSAMLISWQHCASPFLQPRVGPRVKPEIRAALIAR